jgi:hypothetical protein
MADDGSFVVTWRGATAEGIPGVLARRFGADAAAASDPFRASNPWATGQLLPAVAAASDGTAVSIWQTANQDGDSSGIAAREISNECDVDGCAAGDELQVNGAATGAQRAPAIDGDGAGAFVAVWHSSEADGEGDGVVGRRLAVQATACADATGDGSITATDALVALRAALGSASCELCLCDTSGDANLSATDALIILRRAVGQPVQLFCPAC